MAFSPIAKLLAPFGRMSRLPSRISSHHRPLRRFRRLLCLEQLESRLVPSALLSNKAAYAPTDNAVFSGSGHRSVWPGTSSITSARSSTP